MKKNTATKKALYFIAMLTAMFFVSCAGDNKEEAKAEDIEIGPAPGTDSVTPYVDTEHTSQNSLDYAGIYKGVTPCADCEGIETELTLKMDSTFTITQKYLGKGEDAVATKMGKYQWVDGNVIELVGVTDGPARYKVGEGRIWQLDMSGKLIEGALAEKYILKKS
jgi:uncharacterized lipoprotein NlpE involved in copper resistance